MTLPIDEPVVGVRDAVEILESGVVRPMSDLNNIEAALVMMRQANEKIEALRSLKRAREEAINAEMDKLRNRLDFLKSVIVRTLQDHNQKTVSFPGVGKVSRRKKKGSWLVKDEEALMDVLKKEGELENCTRTVVEVKKGELNKLLDAWQDIERVPPCVEKTPDEESVSISYEEEKDIDVDDIASLPVPKKASSSNDLDFS